ncbi:Viral IAP-associated factor-like protein [Zancudomyces culisetae]|uniref:Viral IAP-associated factor-like protein n=1 Tax=Zancudomyces culisetae TaxID=1213189 RepID=A0A1R1PYR8_ZANCU|nr:Viral IAP-associated factor-like protein [Zancudomyces culisetae]|eukprot:OMH86100.1 Viral IAP-associated factor-like protein [Zancudomyces culisetae]
MQDINEDTEWNDALRKMGIIPEKPKVDPNELLDLAVEARDAYEAEKLSKLDLDELDELEDLEDDDVLESYRRQRLSELAAKEKTEKYGEGVVAISKPDYKRQVTDASETCWVVVHLYRDR